MAAGLAIAAAGAAAQVPTRPAVGPQVCGSLQHNFGPYDYRTDREHLPVVDNHHFTPEVEALIRGHTGAIADDLNYTLQSFPNHARALVALVRLGDRLKTEQPPRLPYPIECYFERALRFRPDDSVVRMLYADYLTKHQRPDEALAQLKAVAETAGDNPLTHYNLGLLYLALDRPDEAVRHAQQAAALGNPRTELIDRLKARGLWPAPGASASAPAASAP